MKYDHTFRDILGRIGRLLERRLRGLGARLFVRELSEAAFLRSLNSDFTSIEEFLEQRNSESAPVFFVKSRFRDNVVDIFRSACPGSEPFLISDAENACDHLFDLLGSGPVNLGNPIDWHSDFKVGYQFCQHRYYADIRPASYPGGYDIKIPWELSRCQHFVRLGQAYWVSGKEKYAREFVDQVENWGESNPWPWGVNWASTMDVAIRAVNWLWGYHFFRNSSHFTSEFLLTFYKGLLIHGRHIRRNLENQGAVTNNHYLSNLVGLVYLGVLCPEFNEAAEWREFGLRELWQEVFKQVYADGVSFESSIAYHRLATEMFLSVILLCLLNNISVPSEVLLRLEKMLEFIMYYTKSDGTVPLMGDADNGRLHRLAVFADPEQEWLDHRYLLAIGSMLFERDDFAIATEGQWQEAIWLFSSRPEKLDSIKRRMSLGAKRKKELVFPSRSFEDSGIYTLRVDDSLVFITLGKIGNGGTGSHTHNDALSVDVTMKGQPIFVDRGTFTYTQDYRLRNEYRSIRSHNLPVLDGVESNHFSDATLFSLSNGCDTQCTTWLENPFPMFVGESFRSQGSSGNVIHRREIALLENGLFLLVRDTVSGDASGQLLTTSYYLSNQIDVRFVSHDGMDFDLSGLISQVRLGYLSEKPIEITVEETVLSRNYGSCTPTKVIQVSMDAKLPCSLTWWVDATGRNTIESRYAANHYLDVLGPGQILGGHNGSKSVFDVD